jgi:hypothetical protein
VLTQCDLPRQREVRAFSNLVTALSDTIALSSSLKPAQERPGGPNLSWGVMLTTFDRELFYATMRFIIDL